MSRRSWPIAVNPLWVMMICGVLGWLAATTGFPLLAVLAGVFLTSALLIGWEHFLPARPGFDVDVVDVENLRDELALTTDQLLAAQRRAQSAASGLIAAAEVAVQMEENVRAVIVADLHDTVAQTLVAAAYATYDDDVDRDQLRNMMKDAEFELREVMLAQSPLRDTTASLGDLVTRLLERMRRRNNLHVDVYWPANAPALSYPVAMVVYRFIHETLTNVAKHARTGRASVTLQSNATAVTVTTSDNGPGFDPDRIGDPDRLGLALLRKRCAVVSGEVTLNSMLGGGTVVQLTLPPVLGDP